MADDGAIWLQDRVPQLLAEQNIQARVFSYGYETEFAFASAIDDIERVAENLLNGIRREA